MGKGAKLVNQTVMRFLTPSKTRDPGFVSIVAQGCKTGNGVRCESTRLIGGKGDICSVSHTRSDGKSTLKNSRRGHLIRVELVVVFAKENIFGTGTVGVADCFTKLCQHVQL